MSTRFDWEKNNALADEMYKIFEKCKSEGKVALSLSEVIELMREKYRDLSEIDIKRAINTLYAEDRIYTNIQGYYCL